MILAEFDTPRLRTALRHGLTLRIEPFTVRVRSPIASVAEGLQRNYGDRTVLDDDAFADFSVALTRPWSLRRWLQPQVNFQLDGVIPFKPLPLNQAFPLFEWGLNWCIANHCHQWVMLHAAVLERGGGVVILPAPPGSGKSTLCAALASRGWRLFSDELTLIDPATLEIVPVPRPVNLKNRSIDVIGAHAPDQSLGPRFNDTRKGDVAHMRPPGEAVRRAAERAQPRWIVFPRYVADAPPRVTHIPRPQAVAGLADNCFNYSHLGESAFRTLCAVADRCDSHGFEYGQLDDAMAAFERLANGGWAP